MASSRRGRWARERDKWHADAGRTVWYERLIHGPVGFLLLLCMAGSILAIVELPSFMGWLGLAIAVSSAILVRGFSGEPKPWALLGTSLLYGVFAILNAIGFVNRVVDEWGGAVEGWDVLSLLGGFAFTAVSALASYTFFSDYLARAQESSEDLLGAKTGPKKSEALPGERTQ